MIGSKKLLQITAALMAFGALTPLETGNFAMCLPTARAEVKMYKGVGEMAMSEIESEEITKFRARERAIRSAVEQAGVFLQSYSRLSNFVLTDDEISAITNTRYELIGEPKFERLERSATDLSMITVWRATVNVKVDDSEIKNWLSLTPDERATLIARNNSNKKAAVDSDKRIEELRKKFEASSNDEERARLMSEARTADKTYLAMQKVSEGDELYDALEYSDAIERYDEAIELNPNYADAYLKRGTVFYYDANDYARARADFDKAIELQPNCDEAYVLRGDTYVYLDEAYALAIADYDKALALRPKYADAYHSRGVARYWLKDYAGALADFDKAIEIHPKVKRNYDWRGRVYEALGETEKARLDFEKAATL